MAKQLLVVCQHFWPESFRINDIVDYLSNEEDCEIDVLCGRPNYPSGELTKGYTLWNKRKESYGKATVYRSFEIPRGDNSNARILINYVSFPLSSIFHVPRLAFKKYDAVFAYQLSPVMMSIAAIMVAKVKRIPLTMYVLDLWPENLFSVLPIKNKFAQALVTRLSHWHYKKADKLIALSERMKTRLLEVTQKSESAIIVLPQTCEKIYEDLTYDETLHERFKDKFTVVFTGNISPAQSFGTIIDAAETLKNEGLDAIHWVIVGDGMSRKEVQSSVDQKGLSSYFSFEGHHPIEDIPKYAELANVLVGCLVKSDLLEATIPAKVVSYMASGKPLVLAMDGEVNELINDQARCGYAGETENVVEFAKNIKKLYQLSVGQRAELGDNARAYYFKHFERGHILSTMHDFMFSTRKV